MKFHTYNIPLLYITVAKNKDLSTQQRQMIADLHKSSNWHKNAQADKNTKFAP